MNQAHPPKEPAADLLPPRPSTAIKASEWEQLCFEWAPPRRKKSKAKPAEAQKTAPKATEKLQEPLHGEIALNSPLERFERFNAHGEYFEVPRSPWARLFRRKESIFAHKGDGSRITLKKDKILCDYTDKNLQAALDIAQDQGWDVLKITGGSKAAKAELWFQAQMRGLETQGYTPSEADQKRLLGAQERAKKAPTSQSLSEALDISPQASELRSRQSEEKPRAPEASPSTETERLQHTRKVLLAEVAKCFPMDEKTSAHLENVLNEQLGRLLKSGSPHTLQKFQETVCQGLPTLRQEWEQVQQKTVPPSPTASPRQNPKHHPRQSQEPSQER